VKTKERQYRHLFEKSPIMIYAIDRQGNFLNINQAGVELMGYDSANEIIGKKFQDFFFKDINDLETYQERIHNHGVIAEFNTQMKKKDGNLLFVNLTGALRTTVTGKLKGYEGFVSDMTDGIETKKKIKESEEKYKAILDNSLAGIYMFQNGGYFSYVNKRLVKIMGYESADEIIGRRFWEIVAPEDRELVKKRGLQRERKKTHPRQYSFRMIRKDGSIIWVEMRCSHAPYMGIPAAVGNFIDISKEKKAQEEIQMLSRKLIEGIEEERRSLASDLHDEFGQALTLLQFDMESLQKAIPADLDDPNQVCNKIMEQIQKLAEKIRNTTSRLRPDLLDHLGLVPTLEWYIENFNDHVKNIKIDFQAIGFKRRLSPEVEIVIYRIFQEGLNNITKHSNADRVDIKLTGSHPKVFFMMQDNGVGFKQKDNGMPQEGLSKGIGLLSMKERVASLKGTIKIKSVFNKGTTIRIELPMN
ncbi:MAG: PAS domain S-box protein, partial [Desulfobacteraceae bacterium]|nr:PAS domain S-box protein [Desulfobacteraceae bacterium]